MVFAWRFWAVLSLENPLKSKKIESLKSIRVYVTFNRWIRSMIDFREFLQTTFRKACDNLKYFYSDNPGQNIWPPPSPLKQC